MMQRQMRPSRALMRHASQHMVSHRLHRLCRPHRPHRPHSHCCRPHCARQVPEFKQWREDYMAKTMRAEDGTTEHEIHREVLRRARSPEAGTGDDQVTDMTLKLVQQMATDQMCMHSHRKLEN